MATINGTSSNDTLNGTASKDTISGGAGNDIVNGVAGNDSLYGGDGNDTINGGSGNDYINAGSGNDTLDGGSGSDKLYAGAGDDKLIYNVSENRGACDYYNGETGNDTLVLIFTQSLLQQLASQNCYSSTTAYINALTAYFNCRAGSSFDLSSFGLNLQVNKIENLIIQISSTNVAPVAVNDVGAVNEDVILTKSASAGLLINDTDVNIGDTKAVSSISKGSLSASVNSSTAGVITTDYGKLTVNADGSYSYVANGSLSNVLRQGVTATDVFTYTMKDAAGASASATLTITITGQNDAPIAVADVGNVTQNATLSILQSAGLLINDIDPDVGDTKAVSQISKGTTNVVLSSSTPGVITSIYGTLTVYADGHYNYVANGAASVALPKDVTAVDEFTYTMKDAVGATSSTTLKITVKGINDTPTAVADAGAVNQGATLNVAVGSGLLINDTDKDTGDTKAVSQISKGATNVVVSSSTPGVITSTYGTLTVYADGHYNYVANGAASLALASGATATDVFSYTMKDSQGATSSTNLTMTITGVTNNHAPVAAADTYSTNEDTFLVIPVATGVLGNDSDIDGNALNAILVTGPAHGTLVLNANGSFTYTPTANYNGADSFTYKANDGSLNSNIATVNITVSPVNDAPLANNDNYSVDEDGVLNILIPGVLGNDSDIDGDALTSILVSGPTHGVLSLNSDGSFTYTPNTNYNGDDSFVYKASDGLLSSNATVSINVVAVNDAPIAVDNTVTTAENNSYQFQSADFGFNDPNDLPANHLLAVKIFTVPTSGELRWNDGATLHVVHAGDSISAADIQAGYLYFVPTTNPDDTPSGPHDTSQSTAPNPGGPPPSHGGSSTPSAPADSFTFLVQDDGGIANGGVDLSQTPNTMTINVTSVNHAPIINGGDLVDIHLAENNLIVTQVSATDADLPPQTLTYSIVGGSDQLLFAIDPQSGALSFVAAPDYENPADVDLNNIYEVVVQVSDGSLVDTQTINVTVTPTNEFGVGVVTDANAAANAVDENAALGTVVGITALATDGDGDVVTYSLDNDAGGLFAIDADTGVVTVAGALDYETASSYQIVVRATSADTSSSTENFTININPLNDNAPIINGGDLVDIHLAENNLFVTQVSATDADLPQQGLTYSIADGLDGALFQIDSQTGELSFITAPDYEHPTDSNFNNVYVVFVEVSDGELITQQTIRVTVQPANDNAPIINGGDLVDINIAENNLIVTQISATDADLPQQGLTYSIADGIDGALFQIDSQTGELSFITAPDYEHPTDSNFNNVYVVFVEVSDGELITQQTIRVTVQPANDNAPIINGGDLVDINIAENNLIVTQISATDADLPQQGLTYSIADGLDGALFQIDSQTGELSFITAPDYEHPTDSNFNNVYVVFVEVSDGELITQQTIRVTVQPANDNAPIINGGDLVDIHLAENNLIVTQISATDADLPLQTLTYSIVGGADQLLFAIGPQSGALSFVAAPDYENPADVDLNNIYEVVVQVSDGSLVDTQTINVTVTPTNEFGVGVVTDANAAANAVDENAALGTVVGITALATDGDGDVVTYSLDNDAGGLFAIDADTGVVTVAGALDYETASSYQIVVRAISADTSSSTENFTININPLNDNAPVIISNGGDASANINIPENTTVVTIVVAGDADLPPQTLLYEIAGGADAALFQINSAGELSFIAAPDYENPVGSDNDYEVIVRVKDGAGLDALSDEQTIHVHVTPVNEAPFAFSDSFSPNEDTVLNIPAHVLSYGDFDVEDVLTVSVVNNPLHGVLVLNPDGSFIYTPNENYNGLDSFTYRVFDGSLYSAGVGTVSINVSPINDAPAGTDKIITTNEDTNYIFAASDFGFSDLNDNPENDFAAVKITQVPLAGQLIWNDGINPHVVTNNELINIADINNNYLKFVPGLNENGSDYASFTFQVQDNGSGVFPNVNLDPTVNIMTINVTTVNDAPFAFSDSFSPNEDTVLNIPAHVLSYGDFDVEDVLTVSVVNNPLHGVLVLNPDGSFIYTPNENYNGLDSFTYRVFDGSLYSAGVGTVSINVSPINDAPAGTDKIITTNEDTNYIFAASDFGFSDLNDNPENDFAAVKITQVPLAGQLIWNDGINSHVVTNNELINIADINNNYLKFVPGLNENGSDYASFTFQVQDNGSGVFPNVNLDPTVNTMTINVTAVNDAPFAFSDSFSPNEDTVLNIPAHVLSYGDFDVGDVLTVSVFNNPLHGLLVLNPDGSFIYTPNENYNGLDSFTYRVFDGSLYSAGVGTVSINVSPINDAPAGTDKIITTNEDTNYIFAASDFGFSDLNDNPENDFAAVKITQVPLAGQLIWNDGINPHVVTNNELINIADINNNYLKFVPGLNENGSDYASFTFQVQDNGGVLDGGIDTDQSPNAIIINVTPVNDAPVFATPSYNFSITENLPNGFSVGTVTATDIENNLINYSIIAGNINNAFSININTGAITVNNYLQLDYETTPVFNLIIQALDNGIPAASSTTAVMVNLTDLPNLFTGSVDTVDFSTLFSPLYANYDGNFYNALAGADNVTLLPYSDEATSMGFDFNQTFFAGADNDTVSFAASATNRQLTTMNIDLGTGIDSLTLTSGNDYNLVLSNAETITGANGNDQITLNTVLTSGVINLGLGLDVLNIATSANNTITVSNIETINVAGLGSSNDIITSTTLFSAGSNVNLGNGSADVLNLAAGTNELSASNIENFNGTTSSDTLIFSNAQTYISNTITINLGLGTDTLILSSNGTDNRLAVNNVETIIGSDLNDVITINSANIINLGLGTGDTVNFSVAGSITLSLAGVEFVNAGGLDETLIISNPQSGLKIDMSSGADTLRLSNAGANTVTVTNTETILVNATTGAFDDIVTVTTGLSAGNFNLEAGTGDTINLANANNTVIVRNTEIINGGTQNDAITLNTALLNGNIALGTGVDSVTLTATGLFSFSATGVESIIGTTSNFDDLTLLNAQNDPLVSLTVDLGAGTSDKLTLANGGNTLTVANTETINGGSGNDVITLSSVSTGTVGLGAGTDSLILLGGGANSVTVSSIESISIASDGNFNDTVVALTGFTSGASVNLGGGVADRVNLNTNINTVALFGVESITGTASGDTLTLSNVQNGLSVDLAGANDTLNLATGDNNLIVNNVEVINGTSSDDQLTLSNAQSNLSVNLGGGLDSLILFSAGANTLTVSNTEIITGGVQSDVITLGAAQTSGVINLGNGIDRLALFTDSTVTIGVGQLDVTNTETILGASGNETVTFSAAQNGGSSDVILVDLAGGTDALNLSSSGVNTLSISGIETVSVTGVGVFDDLLTALTTFSGGSVDLGLGTDTLNLASGVNFLSINNLESIYGSTLDDQLTLSSAQNGVSIDLDLGTDTLSISPTNLSLSVFNVENLQTTNVSSTLTLLNNQNGIQILMQLVGSNNDVLKLAVGTNTITANSIETILGTNSDDVLTLNNVQNNNTIDLALGTDILNLYSSGANTLTVRNVETVTGGTQNDTITLGAAQTNGVIDLAGGTDILTLSSLGANTLTVSNTETIIGGTQNDVIALGAAQTIGVINLGGGSDNLILFAGSTVTIGSGVGQLNLSNTETILGTDSNETITFAAAQTNLVVDLGNGADRLTLSSTGVNLLTVSNTETIIGGTADDTITLGAAQTVGVINLQGGTDTLVLSSLGANTLTVSNTESIIGGTQNDAITLGAAQTSGVINLGGGTDTLILSSAGANTLTISNTETITGSSAIDNLTVSAAISTVVVINGAGGADTIVGGVENDSIIGGLGIDTLTGGIGADTFVFNSASDYSSTEVINGTQEDGTLDTLLLLFGNGVAYDFTSAGANITNIDQILLGQDSDSISLILDEDVIAGADRNGNGSVGDLLIAASVPIFHGVVIDASAQNSTSDYIEVDGTNLNGGDIITGSDGPDIIMGGLGADTIIGGTGADTYIVRATVDFLIDGSSDSNFQAADKISTLSSLDTLKVVATEVHNFNHASNTFIEPGGLVGIVDLNANGTYTNFTGNTDAGDVVLNFINATTLANFQARIAYDITAGTGSDTITTGSLDDILTGGAGADSLNGGSGNDVFVINAVTNSSSDSGRVQNIGNSNDTGQDVVTGFALGGDVLKIVGTNVSNFTHGTDTALGTAAGVDNGTVGSFTLNTGLVNLSHEATLTIDPGDVAVTFASPGGLTFNETNFEASLQYELTGTAGINTIGTGALDDILTGGGGADTLTGGAGADIFKFTGTGDLGDTITDFSAAQLDKLWFSAAAFNGDSGTALASGALATSTVHNGANASNYWIFDNVARQLYYDADASGVGVGVLVANLTGVTVLNNTDIMFG